MSGAEVLVVSKKQIGFVCIVLATILFSLMEVTLKGVSAHFHPFQLNFTRFLIGGLVLLPFALRALRRRPPDASKLDGAALAKIAGLGFVGVFVSMTFYQLSVMHTDASVVAILFSSNPLFVMLLAALLLGEAIHRHNVAALVLELLGIVVIVSPWNMQLDPYGVLFVMIAVLAFALYGVLGKKEGAKFGVFVTTCFGFLFGSVEMMLVALLTHVPAVAALLQQTPLRDYADIPFFSGYSLEILPAFLFVCIGVTGIGYVAYFMAMECTSAGAASLVFFFKPVLAPILALLLLQEAIPGNRIAGIVIILIASLINLSPAIRELRRRRSVAQEVQ